MRRKIELPVVAKDLSHGKVQLHVVVFALDSLEDSNLKALRAYPATVPTTQYPDCSMCPDVFAP